MIIMFFDSAVIVVLGDFIINTLEASRKYLAIISYWCVVIGLLIQLVLLINTLVTRNVHKENEKLAKQFLEKQNEHYQYLEKREYETKKFRHDIKNHLILLENFMSTKKYEEAQDYLSNINEKVALFSNQISVNNGIADAILNRFYTEAKEKGIMLKVSGHFPMECYITAYDICTILSNLLSNAILAETETEGKEVLVNIKYTDNKVLLTVENDYAHELNEVDGIFKTTKQDSLGHGYGLSNVKECVEKNGGYLSIATENHRFKVMIMILNEKEEML
ncbi:MAG: GHKL domain-containing protein [Roseburia sp.]|nr:GHKL domain-containing protein [Roseburia sp.]